MVLAAPLLQATPALAVEWTIGAGAGYAPDYEGSADYEAVPFWSLRAAGLYAPTTYVDIVATKLTSNLVPHPNLRLGPLVEYIPRRGHVQNNAVDDLKNVDPARILGGLLGWDFVDTPAQTLGVEVQARVDVADGHGYLVTPAVRLRRAFAAQLSLAGALVGIYASGAYMSDYFGIDAADAARSGLHRYDANAGFKDAGFDLVFGFGQGPGWQARLIGRYRRVLDDAADSPIVLRGRSRGLRVLTNADAADSRETLSVVTRDPPHGVCRRLASAAASALSARQRSAARQQINWPKGATNEPPEKAQIQGCTRQSAA
jgi:outer membrane scaffolding protein for murein synthesis (MipA/OmpV family)